MRAKKFLFYLITILLGGCVPVMSLHPLFTEENLVFEEKLLGTWVDDPNSPKSTWEFKRVEDSAQKEGELNPPKKPEKAYKLILLNNEDNTKGSFYAHLIKLEDRLFLDVYPSQLPCAQPDPNEDWLLNTFFLIPGHSFVIIDSIEPRLKMRWTNQDELKKLLKEKPDAVKHELVEDGIILTASTEQLQPFVFKYADDERVFSEETILTRSKTTKK
jgi:hypothetical protein